MPKRNTDLRERLNPAAGTDISIVFGGWNIDDAEISSLGPVCSSPATYGTAKQTSIGTFPSKNPA
ncbi:MAG: hypothetical protein ACT4P3_00060 [Betaproteobacteria bacterium]